MESLSSKLSFYDFLNILVTGFLWLNLFYEPVGNGISWIYISAISFLIGLVYHQLMECSIGKIIRNCSKIRKNAYDAVERVINERPMPDSSEKNYLYAYYLVVQNNCLMNIPVLEAHIAFIRNIWIVLLFYLVTLCSSCPLVDRLRGICASCDIVIVITVLLITLPFVWYKLQSKVSYLVWEGAYFIKYIKEEKENEKNHSK